MELFNKIRKKYIISIAISIIIVIFIAANIYRINYGSNESKYVAEEGVLNLEQWDIVNENLVKLEGEWEFYSGKHIDPEESFENEGREYVDVPGDWKTYLKGEGLENGSGTYRLTIKVPEDTTYGIKAKTIRTSHKIYLNGEQIAQMGNPSLSKDKLIAESRYQTGVGKSLSGEIELVLHISSANYGAGGIIKPLEIGSFDSVMKADNRNILLEGLIAAICLTLSLYFFVMYLQRDREPYLIYFSGVNLFMGLYLSTMDEQILALLYNYKPNERLGIQLLAMILTGLCFLRFTYHFFKETTSKKLVNIITIFMLSILSAIIITISKNRLNLLSITQIVSMQMGAVLSIVAAYLYILYVLVREIYRKSNLIEYIIVIATCMISYWIILYTKVFTEIDLGNTPAFIILIMMFSITSLMTERLQLDYREARRLYLKSERYDTLKDEFFEKASIQFKGTLEIMLGLIKKLLEGEEGVLNADQQESLFKVNQETKSLRRIADDLMDTSLISRGEVKLSSNPINAYESVKDVLKEIEILFQYDDSITIKNNIARDFPILKADSNKFRQIIYDLIDNAIKYTEEGEISISAKILGEQAEIKVSDTGRGIEEEYLDEIFDIFYQKNDSDDLNENLGIGLYTAKRLVEMQGGSIKADSIYGKGTTISFTLPLYTEEDRANNITEIYNKYDLHNMPVNKETKEIRAEKILIVEELEKDQRILESIIENLEYQAIIANTGKEALEVLKGEKIDLVILDFMIADMTSHKLCSEIRRNYSMGELPIIILTASGRTIDLISSFDYGVNDFQRKPIDTDELESRIQSLLLIKASAEEGLEKEFQYFYSQISPHFLYNTLNSIIGLSYISAEKSRKALSNLSVYLRGKLDIHRRKGFVSLESELELVTAYLEIEKLRYGERLKVKYHIEEDLKASIPPLTLQPIVENAVNHGLETMEDGRVEIQAGKVEDGFISIKVKDNGIGMDREKRKELLEGHGKGIGFKNVMERIKILKGASLALESSPGKGTQVEIIIPEVGKNEKNEGNFN